MRLKTTFVFGLIAGTAFIAGAEEFVTPGNGTQYNLNLLAETSGSNVTKEAEGIYIISDDVTVSADDSFILGEGVTSVKFGNNVTFRVNGYCEFDAGSGRTLFTRNQESDEPKGLLIAYDGESNPFLHNIDFEYAALRCFGNKGLSINECNFSHANGNMNSTGAIALGSSGAVFTITNCRFENNTVPAIGGGANVAVGVTISNCYFYNNNTSNSNKPQINITVGGDLPIAISNCYIKGGDLNKVGGIAIGNMLQIPGENKVLITDCEIIENRYGITGIGPMNFEIRNNTLVDNNHETNANNGGSGISLSGAGTNLNAIISGNTIKNNLWGITVINCNDVNLGQIGNENSPGNNVFENNANNGTPYDLYNNSNKTIYAQNNTWSVPEQTEELIETVIFHQHDNSALGEVIFMPANAGNGVNVVENDEIRIEGNKVVLPYGKDTLVEIFALDGTLIEKGFSQESVYSLENLAAGIYLVKVDNKALKINI